MAATNTVNHIAYVIDASSSMRPHREALIKVMDEQTAYLARRSQEMGQETRISVYMFNYTVTCLIWDMDVLRLPSMRDLYRPEGMTALISGTLRTIDDLREIPTKHGDHSFLVFVGTDGEENYSGQVSRSHTPTLLSATLSGLPDNWTVAALVPDVRGVMDAKRFGFPAGNIDKWDATTDRGIEEAGERLQAATDSYMVSRSAGIKGTTRLFDTSAAAVNPTTVKAAMKPADPASYMLHFIPPVTSPFPRALSRRAKYHLYNYVTGTLGVQFRLGGNYYELIKTETVQPQKDLALEHKKTGEVFIGRAVRSLIGLPENEKVRLRPDFNDEYRIFVRSDSTNRNMLEGQRLLMVK